MNNSKWFFLEWRCNNCDWKTVRGARAFAVREVTDRGVSLETPDPCRACGKALKIVPDRQRRWKLVGKKLKLM